MSINDEVLTVQELHEARKPIPQLLCLAARKKMRKDTKDLLKNTGANNEIVSNLAESHDRIRSYLNCLG